MQDVFIVWLQFFQQILGRMGNAAKIPDGEIWTLPPHLLEVKDKRHLTLFCQKQCFLETLYGCRELP